MQTTRNKVSIVTGGNKGIGKAISELFSEKGFKVVVFDKENNPEIVDRGDLDYCNCDIRDEEKVSEMVSYVDDSYGHIDALINNAGVFLQEGELTDLEREVLDEILDVNVKGTLLMSKHVLKKMKKQKSGSIVNIASILGEIGTESATAYSSSKAAVIGMTRSMAIENAQYNINVNSISPSVVETDMIRGKLEEDLSFKERLRKSHPYKRFSSPEEIAELALFLVSDGSSFINGQNILVDGGRSIYDR